MALLSVGLATALYAGLSRLVALDALYLTIYPAMILVAILAGFGPGLLVAILGGLLMEVLFSDDAPAVLNFSAGLRLVVVILSSAFLGWVGERLRQARSLARADAEAAHASENRYHALFENMTEGFALHEMIFDQTGRPVDYRFLELNPAFERLTGLKREHAVGKTVLELIPDNEPSWVETYGRVVMTGEPAHIEQYSKPLGRWYEAFAYRPEPGRFAVMFTDITSRKRQEEAPRQSEQLYRAIGETIDFGVWVCAPDGRNIYASKSFLKLVGQTQEQCSNFGWGDVLHPDDTEKTIAAWRECVRTGGTWDIEHRYRGMDGKWHPILARGVPLKNDRGEVICWAGINLDISRLKQAEEAAIAAKIAAEAANAAKDRFIAMLSHELRTPLTPALAAADLLVRDGRLPESIREDLAMIARSINLEARLIDDLLQITHIVSGKLLLRQERTDVAATIREAARICANDLEAKGLRLTIEVPDAPCPMMADAARLHQVFWNLMKNAIKFTPKGGLVAVRCHVTDEAKGEGRRDQDQRSAGVDGLMRVVIVEVSDNGIGIEPEVLPRLFRPFEQGHRIVSDAYGGLGLGLAIAKAVVEMHGGDIEARSEGKGKGATFRVRLPLMRSGAEAGEVLPSPAEPEPALDSPKPRSRPLRILLVEDHADTARIISRLLEEEGHSVIHTRSMLAAIAQIQTANFDLLISDLGLPDGTGYELMQWLSAASLRVPAIAMSGYGTPEDIEKSRAAGFAEHITKPVEFGALARVVARMGDQIEVAVTTRLRVSPAALPAPRSQRTEGPERQLERMQPPD